MGYASGWAFIIILPTGFLVWKVAIFLAVRVMYRVTRCVRLCSKSGVGWGSLACIDVEIV